MELEHTLVILTPYRSLIPVRIRKAAKRSYNT